MSGSGHLNVRVIHATTGEIICASGGVLSHWIGKGCRAS
jgi:hypothetical protein